MDKTNTDRPRGSTLSEISSISNTERENRSNSTIYESSLCQRDEYEIVWKSGSLGIWFQPNFADFTTVARVQPQGNETIGLNKVKIGDILVMINGQRAPNSFDNTITCLRNAKKPTLIRFQSVKQELPRYHVVSSGPCYSIVWPNDQKLGLSFHRDPISYHTIVHSININEHTQTNGIQQVSIGDILVKVGPYETEKLSFEDTIAILKIIERPVLLILSTPKNFNSRDTSRDTDTTFNSSCASFRSLSNSSSDKFRPSMNPEDIVVEYDVLYKGGKLGIVLMEGHENGYPIIYKVKDRSTSEGLEKSHKGDELILIDDIDTKELGFDGTVHKLQSIHSTVRLHFRKGKKHISYTGMIFEVISALFV